MTGIIVWCRIWCALGCMIVAVVEAGQHVLLHGALGPAFVAMVFGAVGAVVVMPDPEDLT